MPGEIVYRPADFQPTIDGMRAVGRAFETAGHELFLVGGIVRDTLLGVHGDAADIDATTSAHPGTIKELLRPFASALWTQGERFGTIGARIGPFDVEVTTYRAEDYDPDSRKPEVAFGHDLRTDLARRDFTINAMAVSLVDEQLHDPFGGLDDLVARRLRTPLDPRVSFSDDPLRMLRAARFLPRFGLTADADLLEAARSLAARLDIVSRERVHDELERLLHVAEPRRGLEFLDDVGLLPRVLGFEPAPSTISASFRLVDACTVRSRRRIGLLLPHGADTAEGVLRRLRASTDDRRHTVRSIALIESLGDREVSAAGARRLVADARNDLAVVDDVLAIGRLCDNTAVVATALRSALDELAVDEPLVPTGPPLDGETIMSTFGIEPGPSVGKAVAFLEQRRIELGPLTPEQAVDELRRWGGVGPA
ncbi:MAG: hypothetical protein R2733_09420 [Acidimicrobiales bacterium]